MEATTQILPVLDMAELQKKANEYAMKGAETAIKEYYTGYDSPYKKALTEKLVGKGVTESINIPDIIGILNESISKEVDTIANTAISKTFLPMVKDFLTKAESELKLSDILHEFISYTGYEYDRDKYHENYSVEIEKEDGSFTCLVLSDGKITCKLYFYQKSAKSESPKIYELYTLPRIEDKSGRYGHSSTDQTMKVSMDGVTLEIPFIKGVLENKFVSYIAKLIIAKTQVTFDVDDFQSDMFPERCHC